MKSLQQTYTIKAPVARVWQALVDPKIIDQWGGGHADMNDQVGTKFSLWDGDVHGVNTGVVEEKTLEQDWSAKHWSEPSQLKFGLSEKDGVTTVNLEQTNIPDSELEDIEKGWKEYYMGPLKDLLEK